MAETIRKAKKEHEKEMNRAGAAGLRRPTADEPPAKRAAVAGGRRFSVVKTWTGKGQPPKAGITYMAIAKDEIVVAVGEEDKDGWVEV